MPEQWRFYLSNVNDALASIFVDLAAKTVAPDPNLPTLLWVWVRFQSPQPNGLSSNEESQTLFAIDDAVAGALRSKLAARHVGNITTQGRREFYYYAPSSGGFDEALASAMGQFPMYQVAHGDKSDPEWSQYLDVLYPTDEQLNSVENLQVLAQLKKHGDTLTAARPIEHYAYFPSQAQADQFSSEIENLGYKRSEAGAHHVNDGPNPYGVVFQRIDIPEPARIDATTLELRLLAEANGGDYDGWETQVIKNAEGKGLLSQIGALFKRGN